MTKKNSVPPTLCTKNGVYNEESTQSEDSTVISPDLCENPTLCTENEAFCAENTILHSENPEVSSDTCAENGIKAEDIGFMRRAIELAREAEARDEVPVGALVVRDGEIVAEGFNTRESDKCAVCHAEINAIVAACHKLGGWRLPGTTIYVTMEPCAMCAGAIMNARIPRVVYGAPDLRFGAMGSLFDLSEMAVNHRPGVTRGVLGDECANILTSYFKRKRN